MIIRLWACTSSILFCIFSNANAQQGVTTFGIQFKPMVPSKFFETSAETYSTDELTMTLTPRFGINFGCIIRKGFTPTWSLETGINLVQRNYRLQFEHDQLPEKETMNYRFIGYEIPLQGLLYLRLGENLYVNASGGMSIDLYPSNVETSNGYFVDSLAFDFYQKTIRQSWLQASVLANIGFEWRTKKSGYFYLGASYHRPFNSIAYVYAEIKIDTNPAAVTYPVSGNYLTIDLRYFFHEDPERRKKN
jgi:hypothetical protein